MAGWLPGLLRGKVAISYNSHYSVECLGVCVCPLVAATCDLRRRNELVTYCNNVSHSSFVMPETLSLAGSSPDICVCSIFSSRMFLLRALPVRFLFHRFSSLLFRSVSSRLVPFFHTVHVCPFRKLSSRQKELLEELRSEEEKLEGKSPSSSRPRKENEGYGGDWDGDKGSNERSGISGFMQDAFDRVKTHLAGKAAKENASGSNSS